MCACAHVLFEHRHKYAQISCGCKDDFHASNVHKEVGIRMRHTGPFSVRLDLWTIFCPFVVCLPKHTSFPEHTHAKSAMIQLVLNISVSIRDGTNVSVSVVDVDFVHIRQAKWTWCTLFLSSRLLAGVSVRVCLFLVTPSTPSKRCVRVHNSNIDCAFACWRYA